MAHWQDVGGQLGGVTRDIFSEGLQLPFVKSFRAGIENPEITAIIKANVRVPERAMGDMRAQLASIRTGERRVMHLLKRYGNEAFKQSIRLIYEQSEKVARAAVEKIPDGVYEAESFMDDDGVNLAQTYSDQSPGRSQRRQNDDRSERCQPAGGGILQLRHYRRALSRRSCFQVCHGAAVTADQRRLVSAAQDHSSAGREW